MDYGTVQPTKASTFLPGKDNSSLQGKGKANLKTKAKIIWKQLKEYDERASSHTMWANISEIPVI